MAEEKKTETENQEINNKDGSEEKKSNRTYSQSEFDSRIAEEIKKIQEKYTGFDDMKAELEKVKEERKAKELAELSEIEKAQKVTSELTAQIEALKNENSVLNFNIQKSQILSEQKYATMPEPYKKMVSGKDTEEIRKSADEVYEQYTEFVKSLTKKDDFVPPDISKNETQPTTPESVAESVGNSIKRAFNIK